MVAPAAEEMVVALVVVATFRQAAVEAPVAEKEVVVSPCPAG
jgi:hypothetical protein